MNYVKFLFIVFYCFFVASFFTFAKSNLYIQSPEFKNLESNQTSDSVKLISANAKGNSKDCIFNFAESYLFLSSNSPKSVYINDDFSLSTLSMIYGLKLSFTFADFRFYQKSNTLSFSQIYSFKNFSDFASNFKKPSWSLKIDFDDFLSYCSRENSFFKSFSFPFSLFLGTLSYSEAVKKLRNPNLFNSNSAFSATGIFNQGLGTSLVSKSFSEKPFSIAASFNKKNFGIESSFSSDKNFFLSTNFNLIPLNLFRVNSMFCFSLYNSTCKDEQSWRFNKPFFTSDNKIALYSESTIKFPFIKTKISATLIENPFNSIRFIASIENIFHFSFLSLNTGFLFSDNLFYSNKSPIFTIDNSLFNSIYQFKINPQAELKFKNGFSLKSGIALFYDYSLDEDFINPNYEKNINSSAEVKLNLIKNIFSLQYKISKLNLANQEHSFLLKYSHYFDKLTLSSNLKFSFLPFSYSTSTDLSQAAGIFLYFKKFPVKSISLSSTLIFKNNSLYPTVNLGISTNFSFKKVKFSGKFQLKHSIVVE